MHSNFTTKTAAPILGALMACAFALSTQAAAQDLGPAQQTISSQGLDLTTPAGVAALRHRVAVGALKACQDAAGPGGISDDAMTACRATATRQAWAQADMMVAEAPTRGMVATLEAANEPRQ